MNTSLLSPETTSPADMKEIPTDVMDFIIKSRIYDRLENFAMREKLTKVHVKNIIKQVIYGIDTSKPCGKEINMNEYESPSVEPKLTRAKKKMLVQQHQRLIGNEISQSCERNSSQDKILTCDNTVSVSETTSLVTTEFPEDDDDDEYKPDLDEQGSIISDEESFMSNFDSPHSLSRDHQIHKDSICSLTPKITTTPKTHIMTPCKRIRMTAISEKPVVQRTLKFSEEEPVQMICSRTRSKYPMTDTPLEYLEMSFNPPDITPDMYETEVDDEEWKKFLLDFVQPEDTTKVPHDDDDQVDPEYDLWADAAGANPSFDELKEELRGDRGVMIPKKEVNQLLTEYLDSYGEDACNPLISSDVEEQNSQIIQESETGVCTPLNESTTEVMEQKGEMNLTDDKKIFEDEGKVEVKNDSIITFSEPITITYLLHEFPSNLIEVLQSQLAEHVQLLTQSILMTCYDKRLSNVENGCKNMLNELDAVGRINSSKSYAHTFNLKPALETVAQYDSKRDECLKELKGKPDNRTSKRCSRQFLPHFPKIFDNIFLESWAFPFAHLLPYGLFWICYHGRRKGFLRSEYLLIASGFSDEVSDLSLFKIERNEQTRSLFNPDFMKICKTVLKNTGIPSTLQIFSDNLKNLMKKNLWEGLHEDNPFIIFTKTGIVNLPKARVHNLSKNAPCALKDMTPTFLPNLYNRMVKNYWRIKIMPELHKYPKEKKVNQTSKKEKILIIQKGETTKIVVPEGHTVLASNEDNKELIPIITPDGDNIKETEIIFPKEEISPPSVSHPFFFNNAKSNRPINTVLPMQVEQDETPAAHPDFDMLSRQPFSSTIYLNPSSSSIITPISTIDKSGNAFPSSQLGNAYFTSKSNHISQISAPSSLVQTTACINQLPQVASHGSVESLQLSSPAAGISSSTYQGGEYYTFPDPNNAWIIPCSQNIINNGSGTLYVVAPNNDSVTSLLPINNNPNLSSSIVSQCNSSSTFNASASPLNMPLLIVSPQKLNMERAHISNESNNNSLPLCYSMTPTPQNLNVQLPGQAVSPVIYPLQLFSIPNASFISNGHTSIESKPCTYEQTSAVESEKTKDFINSSKKIRIETSPQCEEMKMSNLSDEEAASSVMNSPRDNFNFEGEDVESETRTTFIDDPSPETIIVDEELEKEDKMLSNMEQETENYEFYFFKKVKAALKAGRGNGFKKVLTALSCFACGEESPEATFSSVCEILKDHPDLQTQFLLFFNSEQAEKVGKSAEYRVVMCAKHIYDNHVTPDLIDKGKVIDTVRWVLSLPDITADKIYYLLRPILSLQPNLLDKLDDS